jgi:succinate dehydrogenase / fumarate reductase iron-sulfur subunit
MRLRRRAGTDYDIVDRNNGYRHEEAFTGLIRDYGLLNEAELLPRSYGGDSWWAKFHPRAAAELLSSLSTVVTGVARRKIGPKIALFGHKLDKRDLGSVKRIYDEVEGRDRRVELNLYVSGYEDEPDEVGSAASSPEQAAGPADKSPTFPGPGEESQTSPSESENR